MRVVELLRRRPEDGQVELLARVWCDGPGLPASVEILAPQYREGIELTLAEGARDSAGRALHVADGEAFVAALPDHHRGSRFWAVEVAPDDDRADPQVR
jgi:hypothetical protein